MHTPKPSNAISRSPVALGNVPFFRQVALGAIAGVISVAAVFAEPGPELQRAREAFGTYQKESAAKDAALAQRDAAQIDAHASAARKALLDAQAAYESLGAPQRGEADILFEYANVTRILGYHDRAAEAMETQVARDPKDAKAWALLGASAIECGPKRAPRGLEALRKSIALDGASKDSAVAYLGLGKLYQEQGLYDLATEALTKATANDPANAEAVIRLAALNARAGKILEAETAIDGLGKSAYAHDALTRVLLRESLATFEGDGRYFDDKAENHAAYAKLLYRAARTPEAILAAGRATRLNPKDTATYNFMGSLFTQIGNAEGARTAYQKSLDADSNQPNIAEALKALPPPQSAAPAPAATPSPAPGQ